MRPQYIWSLGIIGLGCFLSLFLFSIDTPYDLWRQLLAGLGALIIAAWFFLFRRYTEPKRLHYILGNVLLSFMALGVVVTTNMLAHRWDTRVDFTEDQQHSLSEQSISILQDLDDDLKITSFFETGSPAESQFKMLIEAFQPHSKHVHVSHHDPNKEPLLAQQNDITQLSEIVVQYKEQTQHIDSYFTEEILISTIISLTKGVVHEICFTTGHQELLIDEFVKAGSMRFARDKLENQNYQAKTLNIAQKGSIPSSCAVLVIAGPVLDFSPFEQEHLAAYIAQGGSVYVLLNIGDTPNLVQSLTRYGFIFKDNAVLELDEQYTLSGGDASYAIINTTDFALHPTAKTLSTNILMQGLRSVEVNDEQQDQSLLELASTSPNSWAESQYKEGPLEFTPGQDIQGPVPVISIIEIDNPDVIPIGNLQRELPKATLSKSPQLKRTPGGKIIVVGSATLVLDELTQRPDLGNLDLFLNGISWMTKEDTQLHARAHDHDVTPLLLSPMQLRIIILVSLILTPGMLLLGAIGAWYWRK